MRLRNYLIRIIREQTDRLIYVSVLRSFPDYERAGRKLRNCAQKKLEIVL
jgi:hypothetical protein